MAVNQFRDTKLEKLEDFDLSNRCHRYRARKRGLDVAKQTPGPKPREFWSLVTKTDGCWIWNGHVDRFGYGLHWDKDRSYRAHRWAWIDQGGEDLTGKVLMHMCDNPSCVRPSHCKPGTNAENQRDKFLKNRQAKGERSGRSKLTEANVLEMRRLRATGMRYKDIARIFNICIDTAQKAVKGVNWRHL